MLRHLEDEVVEALARREQELMRDAGGDHDDVTCVELGFGAVAVTDRARDERSARAEVL